MSIVSIIILKTVSNLRKGIRICPNFRWPLNRLNLACFKLIVFTSSAVFNIWTIFNPFPSKNRQLNTALTPFPSQKHTPCLPYLPFKTYTHRWCACLFSACIIYIHCCCFSGVNVLANWHVPLIERDYTRPLPI